MNPAAAIAAASSGGITLAVDLEPVRRQIGGDHRLGILGPSHGACDGGEAIGAGHVGNMKGDHAGNSV